MQKSRVCPHLATSRELQSPFPAFLQVNCDQVWVASPSTIPSLPDGAFPGVDPVPPAGSEAAPPPPPRPRAPSRTTSREASGAQPRPLFPPRARLRAELPPSLGPPRRVGERRALSRSRRHPRPGPGYTAHLPPGGPRPSRPRLPSCSTGPRPPPRPSRWAGARPAPLLHSRPGVGLCPSGPGASVRPSPFTCSIARPGTQLNRLRQLRVPNRTRRLLEPTRSCRDPRIPPLPRLLTGRAPRGGFLFFPTIGLKSSPSSLLLCHWAVGSNPSALPPPRLRIGLFPTSTAHPRLHDWREGRPSATGIGCLVRQSWPRWPRPLVLFFLEISTFPIGLTDSVRDPPSG